jgi:hypothetical protein
MSKYDVRVGFSGYFQFQKYEVTASTEEEAREFITTELREDGWEAGATLQISRPSAGIPSRYWLMEITDWGIEEMVKAD